VKPTFNPPVLRVAIPAPLRRLFDYLPPEGLDANRASPGVRLRLPFGRREVTGILVETAPSSDFDPGQLKQAGAILDESPLLDDRMLALCRWSADYYQHPIGEVFSAALPRALREGKALPRSGWQLTVRGQGLPEGALKRAPSQARAIALLQSQAREHSVLRDAGVSTAVLRELAGKGLIERCLLDGVTGSGKTEVYLRLIDDAWQPGPTGAGAGAGDRPDAATARALRAAHRRAHGRAALGLADASASGLARPPRGRARLLLGTRSAVFTPLPELGLSSSTRSTTCR
jgi:primosomal protein N' (replication factor Y)